MIKREACPLVVLVAAALLTLTLASCSSSKKMQGSTPAGEPAVFSAEQYLQTVRDNESEATHLTAKLHLKIAMGDQAISSTGTLRMKKDDVIQLSVLDPILHVTEVGRMEFTRTHVLIIDRFNKQYIDLPYDEVDFLKQANVDFNTLQALFWNELFQPGQDEPQAKAYTYQAPDGTAPLTTGAVDISYTDRILKYRFHTEQPTGTLLQTTISGTRGSGAQFVCDYGDFVRFKGKTFPANMTLSFAMGAQSASLTLDLSSLRDNADWSARTYPPASYTKADTENILRALVK